MSWIPSSQTRTTADRDAAGRTPITPFLARLMLSVVFSRPESSQMVSSAACKLSPPPQTAHRMLTRCERPLGGILKRQLGALGSVLYARIPLYESTSPLTLTSAPAHLSPVRRSAASPLPTRAALFRTSRVLFPSTRLPDPSDRPPVLFPSAR